MARSPKEKFEPATVPELRSVCGPVRVALFGAPALRSTRTGKLRPVEAIETDDGEGGLEPVPPVLFVHVQIMFECGSHVMKLKEYLPRLIFQCRHCQSRLAEESGESHRFEFEARPLQLPAFRVRLDAPTIACPGCGQHNVPWWDEIAVQIETALTEAFASITTSGGRI